MDRDDRLKKADIMNRLREGSETNSVTINEFCELLRFNGLSHSHGYFHYTTWGRLQKMLAEVDVGENTKKRLFMMSAASSLNDTNEKRDGFYVASFSFGSEEEVSMWTNYGVPKREAIRIKFPMKAMTRWTIENTIDRITIYVPGKGEDCQFRALDVRPTKIYFADVAYYAGNEPLHGTSRDAVHYSGKKCSFQEEKWREHIQRTNDSLLFKKRGWAYEREVRLIVQFDDAARMQNYTQIAIPFDSVYDAMLDAQNNNGSSVMLGPWYGWDGSKWPLIKGLKKPSLRSSFNGELRMRSNCDVCENRTDPKKCTCPNAEWKLWR